MKIHIKLMNAEMKNLSITSEYEVYENPSLQNIREIVSEFTETLREKDTDGETYYMEQPIPLIIDCLENGWFVVTDEEDNLLYNPFRETSVIDKGKRLKELHDQIQDGLDEVEIITRAFNDLSKEELLHQSTEEIDKAISQIESNYEKETSEMYQRKEELEKELNEVDSKLESVKKDTEKEKNLLEETRNLMREDVVEYTKGDE